MENNNFNKVNEYIDNEVINAKGIPFFDIVVYQNHECIYKYQVLPKDNKNFHSNTRLKMYSCSKPITVTAIMQLVEQGKIKLSDLASKYLKGAKKAFYYENENKKDASKLITIENLLTMSGGLSYNLNRECLKSIDLNKASTVDIINTILEKDPLEFKPGSHCLYSLCLDAIAAIVEVVSGMKYSSYVKKYIFDPLEMNNSSFEPYKWYEETNNVYEVNQSNHKTVIKSINDLYAPFIMGKNYESGGAGLISTIEDYIKFSDALANEGVAKNGYRLLKKETIDEIRKPRVTSMELTSYFTWLSGDDYSYGLGVRTRSKKINNLPLGEFGWDGAAGSYTLIDPTNNIAIAICMSLLNWPDIFANEHVKISDLIYKALKINN